MRFSYGKNHFKSLKKGEELSYLLTNGLGGYSSGSLINSLTRNDHSLFMACTKAPNNRVNLVSKVDEILYVGNEKFELSSQEYVCYTKNKTGFQSIINFTQEYLPQWTYFYCGVEVKKTLVFDYGKNTLGLRYSINNNSGKAVSLEVVPVFVFANKGETLSKPHSYKVDLTSNINTVSANNLSLKIFSNYTSVVETPLLFEYDYYFAHDSVDGRNAVGTGTSFLTYTYNCEKNSICNFDFIFSLEDDVDFSSISIDNLISNEVSRQKSLIYASEIKSDLGKALVRASDQFIVNRESTNGKTIIAGYPFFGDWGRDTMFALLGSCISTKRFDCCRDIFRTFIKYLDKGLMPNIFPEGEIEPLYNTVDASLLFVYAVYEYYKASDDLDFIKNEALSAILYIISWYKKGTDFNIHMDDDGLIVAGEGFHQVTWMDVRFDDILPTARHGKPVEINAFWYNALRIASFFGDKLGLSFEDISLLSEKVKKSFEEKFWNESESCLKDVVSGNDYDLQVRSNQIWAVMVPFSPVNDTMAKAVVDKVYRELYTPYGLRSLSKYDVEFVPSYGGSHFKRDMSYHQGTVWTFPLGGYFISYLKVHNFSEEAKADVREKLSYFADCMMEGCVGQIAEIYDGLYPNESRGCFAQAWSVSEILRVCALLEE